MIKLQKILKVFQSEGVRGVTARIKFKFLLRYNQISSKVQDRVLAKLQRLELTAIVKNNHNPDKAVILYLNVDWNVPLYQRPQHLAVELAKLGNLFFYCTSNEHYDRYQGFCQLEQNLYVTNKYNLLLEQINVDNKWIMVSSTFMRYSIADLEFLKSKGYKIIYECLDEISSDITGIKTTNYLLRRHSLINDSLVDLVLSTSKNLYNEMLPKIPQSRLIYHPNAANYDHFHVKKTDKVSSQMELIVLEGKPIIGYYGALADWIDYDLLNFVAKQRDKWNVVLIGWNYDQSMEALIKVANLHYLGIIPYKELPQYGICFDVAIIPFKEGEIAKSTSPLKLFEYMAMNKPVVATKDLIECSKYEGVLMAEDKIDFVDKIEQALTLKDDPSYLKLLDDQAKANTWEQRALQIDEFINKQENGNVV